MSLGKAVLWSTHRGHLEAWGDKGMVPVLEEAS